MDLKHQLNNLIKNDYKTCDLISIDRCTDCNFILNGNRNIYLGSKIRKLISHQMEKHKFYYFLYHPELIFSFPSLPDYDYNGKEVKNMKHLFWVVHHEDGNHFNDNEWNLVLMLSNEHQQLHRLEKPYDINPIYKYHKIRNLEIWLSSLNPGLYKLNNKLATDLNYKETYHLRRGISSIIDRCNLDISLINNEKGGGCKRWTLQV